MHYNYFMLAKRVILASPPNPPSEMTLLIAKLSLVVAAMFAWPDGVLGQTNNVTSPGRFPSQYVVGILFDLHER